MEATTRTNQIQTIIDSLSSLPTAAAVALRLIDLGKDPEAGVEDYVQVLSGDASLSGRLIVLANSPWSGVRHKVTNTKAAVTLLGLGTVRTVSLSYCMSGLHNELRLDRDESKLFWEPSLCKAVAAREFMQRRDAKLAEDAFAAGLLQDIVAPIAYAVAKDEYRAILESNGPGVSGLLEAERELLGVDHAEAGRMLAQKLELPNELVDLIGYHHDPSRLEDVVESECMRHAVHAAALLPHCRFGWRKQDVEKLSEFVRRDLPDLDCECFIKTVQVEFEKLFAFFYNGEVPDHRLEELMIEAAAETAENTVALTTAVHEAINHAGKLGVEMGEAMASLEQELNRDALTGLLSRIGLEQEAGSLLFRAERESAPFTVAYLDLDQFKSINDTFGHEAGDAALVRFAGSLKEQLPDDAVCGRMGGDEFVVALLGMKEDAARDLMQGVVDSIRSEEFSHEGLPIEISASAGLVHIPVMGPGVDLMKLIAIADRMMYAHKRGSDHRVPCTTPKRQAA